jgi:hypothetical protein
VRRIPFIWLLLIFLTGPAAADQQAQIEESLQRGMEYMLRSALNERNFEDYASDYLFFFADIERFEDPWITERAIAVGTALGEYYLQNIFAWDSADEIVDAASALYALDSLGMEVDAPLAILQLAAPGFPMADYLDYPNSGKDMPDLDLLIDLVIGFHFTDRMGVDIGVSYAEVLPHVADVVYSDVDPVADINHSIDVNNLITHLVYTISGYASWNIPVRLMGRELAYFRSQMPNALVWADPETLSEYVDSLKLFGYGPEDPDVAAGVAVLLAIQKPDGRWEPDDAEDEY